MIYPTPKLQEVDLQVLGFIQGQRDRLRAFTHASPRRWMGSLRRNTFARAIRASNSIEGIHASMENVLAAVENEDPVDIERETWDEIKGYRDAMTYLMQASQDRYFEFSKQFLKSIQFMMIGHDMSKQPGQWRPGSIFIVDQSNGNVVYEGPAPERVDGLVEELVAYLKGPTPEPPIVKAAMAHLNLTMIHPFKDGNGRASRALQTLVIAQEGLLHPVFSSIEEWLGANTRAYYDVLALVGQGKWRPDGDALPWVRFCLKAHYQQAATLIRRMNEYERLYEQMKEVIEKYDLPERAMLPLMDAALGIAITNSWYRREADVSEFVASRDLKRIAETGLLLPEGENRGRKYQGAPFLKGLRVREDGVMADPYELAARLIAGKPTDDVQGELDLSPL